MESSAASDVYKRQLEVPKEGKSKGSVPQTKAMTAIFPKVKRIVTDGTPALVMSYAPEALGRCAQLMKEHEELSMASHVARTLATAGDAARLALPQKVTGISREGSHGIAPGR